jgi:hypothetical protein
LYTGKSSFLTLYFLANSSFSFSPESATGTSAISNSLVLAALTANRLKFSCFSPNAK